MTTGYSNMGVNGALTGTVAEAWGWIGPEEARQRI